VVVVESLVTIGGVALGFWGRTSFAYVGWSKNRARNARLEELEDNITLAQLLE
jgi:3'-phosphoadenosine 5'-phosphosulfate sulfotransferase